MSAAELPLGQPVFFCKGRRILKGSFYENKKRDQDGRLLGAPILRECGWGIDQSWDRWFPAPGRDDPRWVAGKPMPSWGGDGAPQEGQSVLALHESGVVWDDHATREPLPFPGFWGGPMTRYENVVAWMPADPLIDAAAPIPPDVLSGLFPLQVVQARRGEIAAELGWQLALAMQNEGDLYRTHFWPFVQGALVTVQRKRVGLDDWQLGLNTGRSLLIQDWMTKLAINYLAKNPEAVDMEGVDYSMRIKLCSIAACHLLWKYQCARQDEQRAAAQTDQEKG